MTNYYLQRIATGDQFAEGHPVGAWAAQDTLYYEYEHHYSGEWAEETVTSTSAALKYPLKYDPCKLPVSLHVSFLYGEVPDGAAGLVTPEVEMWRGGQKQETGTARESAQKLTRFLQAVLEENHIRSKQLTWGQDMQVYGGAVMGAYYNPGRQLDNEFPIMITRIAPQYFFPTWSQDDYDRLLEATIAYGITPIHAKDMGIEVQSMLTLYSENWTRQR
jgi:hypothetical protein